VRRSGLRGDLAMRQSVFLLGFIVFLAGTAGAQANGIGSPAVSVVAPAASSDAATSRESAQETAAPQLFAVAAEPANDASVALASGRSAADSVSSQGPTSRSSSVQSVFATYNWEAYIGYTFFHFNVTPSYSKNTNGLNVSVQYYPHTGAFGIDGEGVATFASIANQSGKFWAGMGGGRYRFAAPRGLEIWVHGLVGGAKFLPQTALGGQTGLAYETGAGVDVGAFNHRLAFRFAGDMIGTRFFSKNQFSPKFSAGIVFKY
jgi:hypothetical protein